jgi:hypothetical protein
MDGVSSFVKEVLSKHPSWRRVGLTFVFLLSGEQSDGTMAEERTDNGLYRVSTSVIVYPKGDSKGRLQQAAAGVMERINEGFGGGVEQRFYGVSQWRLLSVEVAISPIRVGAGAPTAAALLATGHPLFERAFRSNLGRVLFNPAVDVGCFEHCLAAGLYGRKRNCQLASPKEKYL